MVALMDVATVAQQLKTAEIIITARVQVVMQAIIATATETLISGITVIIGIVIGIEIVTVTAIVIAVGAAMVPQQHHLLISATEVVAVDGTRIVGPVAQAPSTERLST